MATKIVTKNSSTASAVPTASDLVQGELAVNVADKRLFTEDNGGSIVELGTNPSGNITFQDNGKAIFGAGSDLQIYHTGAASKIVDTGTGVLEIQTNGAAINLTGNSGAEFMARFISDGASQLYYDGSAKLATTSTGIDVTGTVTATGLTVDTDTLYVDSTNNRVGIGLTSPLADLHVKSAEPQVLISDASNPSNRFLAFDVGLDADEDTHFITVDQADALAFGEKLEGDDRVIENEWMRITNAGNVGIGTSSPSGKTHSVAADSQVAVMAGGDVSDPLYPAFGFDGQIGSNGGRGAGMYLPSDSTLAWSTAGSERMRIDSSGNVGIGTSSPQGPLHVYGSEYAYIGPNVAGVTPDSATGGIAMGWNKSSGQGESIIAFNKGAGATGGLVFADNNGGTYAERMRIDSSGNLLVGTTSTDPAASGSETGVALKGGGFVSISRYDSAATVNINKIGYDGSLVDFRKDGSTVGSIGSLTQGGATNLVLDSTSAVYFDTNVRPKIDDTYDVGSSSYRFDDIYATNGTIQTSDRNEKQDIAELSEAEQRVAVAAKGLLRKFRWKDSVAEKGDDARIHFGIIAQDLQAAFEAEGLDAGDYAMFISTTWTDEETNEEKTRMGVRYSELLAFIISAI